MKSPRFLFIIAAAWGIIAPVQGQEAALESGQQVNMSIAGVPAGEIQVVSKRYTISGTGNLNLPHIGEISIAGLSRSQVEKKIQNTYISSQIYTRPIITIIVDEDRGTTRSVTVIGEVNRSGPIPYRPGLRLLEACATAGGFSDFADPTSIRLIRDGKTTTHNLKKVGDNPKFNVVLKPNDQIIVRQRGINFNLFKKK